MKNKSVVFIIISIIVVVIIFVGVKGGKYEFTLQDESGREYSFEYYLIKKRIVLI